MWLFMFMSGHSQYEAGGLQWPSSAALDFAWRDSGFDTLLAPGFVLEQDKLTPPVAG